MENPKEEPKRTHYLDELPNIDKDTLAKMWEATKPRVEPKREVFLMNAHGVLDTREPKQETQGYICPQTKKQCDDECCVSAEDCHIQAGIGVIFDCEQETYGSKESDDHIVDTNEMVDQVPDVRKMVEDDNYLTPVDWLMDRIKWIHRETYDYLIKEGQYDVAKRTENAILDKANQLQFSQTEISDEEIENEAEKITNIGNRREYWKQGIKWYREQLKKKQ